MQWEEETGDVLMLLQGTEEKGSLSLSFLLNIRRIQVLILLFAGLFRSFDELEAEMLQGQKLQVLNSEH